MIQKPTKGKHEDSYIRKICNISRKTPDNVREIINAQIIEIALQLAEKNSADTFFGSVKLVNGKLVIDKLSVHVENLLQGKVNTQEVVEELTSND